MQLSRLPSAFKRSVPPPSGGRAGGDDAFGTQLTKVSTVALAIPHADCLPGFISVRRATTGQEFRLCGTFAAYLRLAHANLLKEFLVKKVFIGVTLFFSTVFSVSAFAYPDQTYVLSCKSSSAQIAMTLTASTSTGISTGELTVILAGRKGQIVVDDVLTDVPRHSSKAPKVFAFYAEDRLFALILSKDAISASLERDANAAIVINGQRERAVCTGSQTY
jgi:hypothetical protein